MKYKLALSPILKSRSLLLAHPFNGEVCQKPFFDSALESGFDARIERSEGYLRALNGADGMAAKLVDEMQRRAKLRESEALISANEHANAMNGLETIFTYTPLMALAFAALVAFFFLALLLKKILRERKGQGDKPHMLGNKRP